MGAGLRSPRRCRQLSAAGARYSHDTTRAGDAIETLRAAAVPDELIARMMGVNAASQFGVALGEPAAHRIRGPPSTSRRLLSGSSGVMVSATFTAQPEAEAERVERLLGDREMPLGCRRVAERRGDLRQGHVTVPDFGDRVERSGGGQRGFRAFARRDRLTIVEQ